jgi:hypothetical protein
MTGIKGTEEDTGKRRPEGGEDWYDLMAYHNSLQYPAAKLFDRTKNQMAVEDIIRMIS